MFIFSSTNVTVRNCSIVGNKALEDGGGIRDRFSTNVMISHCLFTDNYAGINGGGMACTQSSGLTLVNCVFTDNKAKHGGGINVQHTAWHMFNSSLANNFAALKGGGMGLWGSPLTLINSSLVGNSAGLAGGGMELFDSNLTMTNSTLTRNSVGQEGGGINNRSSTLIVRNSILWGNTAGNSGDEIHTFFSRTPNPDIQYSCVGGGFPGIGNISENPLFFEDKTGLAFLLPGSPCIDAGDNLVVPPDRFDLDGDRNTDEAIPVDFFGNFRFLNVLSVTDSGNGNGPLVDMGAYEMTGLPLLVLADAQIPESVGVAQIPVNLVWAGSNPTEVEYTITENTAKSGLDYSATNGRLRWEAGIEGPQTIPITILLDEERENAEMFHITLKPVMPNVGVTNSVGNLTILSQDRLFVDLDAIGNNQGDSWENAFTELQDALGAADFSDEIWVAAGTYLPGRERISTFQLVDGVQLYGGFFGNETNLEERNWENNITILSGDLNGNDGPNFSKTGENAYHVVTGANHSLIDGFMITAGRANGGPPRIPADDGNRGAGIMALSCKMMIKNCSITGNRADWQGGGIYSRDSVNIALSNCRITENFSEVFGGGIFISDTTNFTISNSLIANNSAQEGGGITSSGFSNLSQQFDAVSRSNIQNITLTNCAMIGNTATIARGGAIDNRNTSITMINCTFTGNIAKTKGGVIYSLTASPIFRNCILWENIAENFPTFNEIFTDSSNNIKYPADVQYSCIQGGFSGTGNINEDPFFRDLLSGNLRLRPGSPCIDAGDNTVLAGGPTVDLAGKPRLVDDPSMPDTGLGTSPIVDIGAYEYGLASTLVGHWKFDEPMWTGIGHEVIDSSGQGNHGLARNEAQAIRGGKINHSGVFDGGNDYIQLGRIDFNSPLLLRSGGTLMAWFRQRDGAIGQRILDKSFGNAGREGYSLTARSDDQSIILAVNGAVFRTGPGVYDLEEWTHVTAVIEHDRYQIFINGNPEPGTFLSNSPRLPPGRVANMRIGNWTHSTSRGFKGFLDDIRIYNSALELSQITEIIALANPGSNLITHYAFNEGSACLTVDSAGGPDPKDGQLKPDCLTNSPSWHASEGLFGSALEFDGNDDFVDAGLIERGHPLQLTTGGTLMAWFKQRDGDGGQRILDKSDGGAGSNGYSLIAHSGDQSIILTVNGTVFRTDPSVYEIEEWTHVAAVINVNVYEIYVNGIPEPAIFLRGSAQLPPRIETGLRIGTWNHSIGRKFKGLLDDIRIYNTALEANQIANIVADVNPTSNLIAHYAFNEGSECLTVDSAGGLNPKDGQLEPECATNSPVWHKSEGTMGSALEFDGDDDFVDLGLIERGHPLQLDKGGTVMALFRQRDGDGGQRILDKSEGTAGINGYGLVAHANDRSIILAVDGSVFRTGPGAYEFDEWTHVAAVIKEDVYEIYINGNLEPATFRIGIPQLPPEVETTLRIGAWNHARGREFNGFLDDIRIYNTALNPGEITTIMAAANSSSNPIAHYMFNEGSGCQTGDSVGNTDSKEGHLEPACSTNSPVWGDSLGMLGSALEFDGDDDFVDLGLIERGHPLQLTFGGTLMAWFKQRDGDSGQRIVDKSNGKAGANGYGLVVQSDDQSIVLTVNGAVFRTGPDVYAFEEWTHVAAVFKEDVYEIYVSGTSCTGHLLERKRRTPAKW